MAKEAALHQIVAVGGSAAGLELATTLGNTVGRQRKAAVTLIDRARGHLRKPLLHEIAAGSMDVDEHELDYLAQAHWHHLRHRYGEMIGLDRTRNEGLLAATFDEDGRKITPQRAVRYDTLVLAVGSVTAPASKLSDRPSCFCIALPGRTAQEVTQFRRRISTNEFGTPGVKEHAIALETTEQASHRIRVG